jgi:hypothetical protein
MTLTPDLSAALEEASAAAMPAPVEDVQPAEPEQEDALPPEAAEDPTPEQDAEEAAAPEGVAIPGILTEGLATDFALYDSDGPVEVPDITVEYKANGKVRRDRLDQVVKLAQWGVVGSQKAEEAAAAQRRAEEYEQVLAEREAALERLLTDDEYYDAVREAYSNEVSPERRAERAEAEAERLRIESAMAPIAAQGQQFYEGELVPALDMIAQALPAVTREELEQRVEMLLRMHAVDGPGGVPIVPPTKYSAIRQAMVEDIAVWAQVLNARRMPPAPKPAAPKADKALERAQVDAQKAKRAVGRAMRPVATSVTKSAPSGKSAAPNTVDDAMESALANVLGAIS